MGEALWHGAAHADQAIQWIVVIAAVAFAAVLDSGEVAVGVVVVATLEQVFFPLADAVRLEAALFIVLVLAEQQTLLALLLSTGVELMRGQARTVEVDAAELPARLVAVIEFAAIGQAAVLELADAIVFVAQSAPALVFLDESVLQVVFVGKRLMTAVDVD